MWWASVKGSEEEGGTVRVGRRGRVGVMGGILTLNKNFAILVVELVLVHAIYCRSGLKCDHIPLSHIILFLLHHSYLSCSSSAVSWAATQKKKYRN